MFIHIKRIKINFDLFFEDFFWGVRLTNLVVGIKLAKKTETQLTNTNWYYLLES